MRNLAIIPARSGSKGLKDKNIKLLAGKPLLTYSVEEARKTNLFDEIIVSTDSELYARIAREAGASVPWLRSSELSGDTADSWDVVKAELYNYLDTGVRFDTVCLLQPTSPLRTTDDIKGCYELFVKRGAQAVTSVCEVDHSPLFAMVLDETLSLDAFRAYLAELSSTRRQELPTYYRLNGAVYIRRVHYGPEIDLGCSPELAYVMDWRSSIDIDNVDDFRLAELFIQEKMLLRAGR